MYAKALVQAVVYSTHHGPLETSGMLHLQEKEGSCPFLGLKVVLSKSKRTKNLNAYKLPWPGQLPPRVLKECSVVEIAPSLCKLMNASFTTGQSISQSFLLVHNAFH